MADANPSILSRGGNVTSGSRPHSFLDPSQPLVIQQPSRQPALEYASEGAATPPPQYSTRPASSRASVNTPLLGRTVEEVSYGQLFDRRLTPFERFVKGCVHLGGGYVERYSNEYRRPDFRPNTNMSDVQVRTLIQQMKQDLIDSGVIHAGIGGTVCLLYGEFLVLVLGANSILLPVNYATVCGLGFLLNCAVREDCCPSNPTWTSPA